MAAVITYGIASFRRNMARRRIQLGDGTTLTVPDGAVNNYRRCDAKFVFNPCFVEVAGMIEDDYQSQFIAYVKNTSGGSYAAGLLLSATSALTAAGSSTAPNISAGSSVAVTLGSITGTIEAGSLCKFTDAASPNPIQYAICTAVGSGTIRTFDEIPYDMTTPTVVVIPAIIPAASTNASGGEATWVVTATIANGAYAFVYGAALIAGVDTSGYSAVGSKVYLGTAGASTPTAPTATTTTAQRVGRVIVKSATVGQIRYYPYRRAIEQFASTAIQAGSFPSATLTSAHILVGNGSAVATDVAVSGDATLANTGALTITRLPKTVVRTTTQTVTTSTTLVVDDTLTFAMTAGHKYIFELCYFFTTNATGGYKVDFSGGVAVTTIEGAFPLVGASITALTTSSSSTGATYANVIAQGYILANGAGAFNPRIAESANTGSLVARIGSYLTVTDIT